MTKTKKALDEVIELDEVNELDELKRNQRTLFTVVVVLNK